MIDKAINKIYQVSSNIKNVIRWVPIIWNDKDWDYHYLYHILYFKLKNMQEFFESNDTHILYAPKVAKEIKIAKNLAKRLMNDSHLENALMWHNQKFDVVDFCDLFEKVPGENYSVYIGDPNKERKKSFSRCCKHAEYMEEKDLNYLFDYIKKKIRYWWD